MTEFNWNNFINELKKFQKGIENIGGYIRETKIEAPAKEEEILSFKKFKEREYDKLAKLLRENLDIKEIYRILS